MAKKIVIAGGTGFIGSFLVKQFRAAGYEVYIISRQQPGIPWNDTPQIVHALENAEMLINLAGKSVDCRYNRKNREQILTSRTQTTKALGEAILKCSHPPSLWINSSTATIYRHAEDRPMTEASGDIGKGFSVNIASAWEQAFFSFTLSRTRQVALRTAIVLGKDGGAMKPLVRLVRFGLGGRQGKGNQMFSWIHMEDLFSIILFLQANTELKGIYNCSSPNPVTNAGFMAALRNVMHVKFGLPAPAWLLTIGAIIIRTETELILKSRWVVPEGLTREGYIFKYPTLDAALKSII